jgi:hypothetical protein
MALSGSVQPLPAPLSRFLAGLIASETLSNIFGPIIILFTGADNFIYGGFVLDPFQLLMANEPELHLLITLDFIVKALSDVYMLRRSNGLDSGYNIHGIPKDVMIL